MKKILLLLFVGISLNAFAQHPCAIPVVSITSPQLICIDSASTTITATASGGSLPYTYLWSPGGETSSSITVIPPPGNTTYYVTVKNSCGDSAKKSTTITAENPLMTACCNEIILPGQSTILEAYGNSVSYTWMPTVTCLNPLCDSVKVTATVTTTYTVVGSDSAGCQAEERVTITISPAGVQSISQTDVVNIYPNPSSKTFTLNLPAKALVNVCDIMGRLQFSEMEKAGMVTFGKGLTPGIYFLFIDGKPEGKLVKL
jgi:hypothetical protein